MIYLFLIGLVALFLWLNRGDFMHFFKSVFAILAIILGTIFAGIIGLIAAILLPFLFKGNILNNQFTKMKGGYVEYLVALIAKIAKLDGVISPKEAEFIRLILDKNSYNMIERERLKKVFKEAKENPNNYKDVANELKSNFNLSKSERLKIMQSLLYCASIDGFSERKINALKEIAIILDVSSEFAQFINFNNNNRSNNQRNVKDPYSVLGLGANASFVEIKSAYRKLVRKYHPDVLNTQNLSEEEIKKGIEKFHEINEAYEILKEKFNEK